MHQGQQHYNNSMPNPIPQVGSGKGRAYADLTPTFAGKEVSEKTIGSRKFFYRDIKTEDTNVNDYVNMTLHIQLV